MNENDFLENYLWPSGNKLNKAFTHTLPNIDGLKKCGDFIVQCELEDTFSTNIMTTYESDTLGVRLIDVSKNSQNKVTGVFIRLVGTLSLVKTGYPFLLLDAPISNVSLSISEEIEVVKVEDIATKVLIFLPQADPEQRRIFFNHLSEQVKESGISYRESESDFLPDFWGTVWSAESKGVNLGMIRQLRDYAWNSYKGVIEQTKEKALFDYRPFQEHMIFDTAKREHLSFGRKGLSVPVESQAAFFSVLVAGI
jgi:hypothetical protein